LLKSGESITLSRVGLREREFESGFRLVAETYSIVGRSLGVRWPQVWEK
jgi:hypothetical protein